MEIKKIISVLGDDKGSVVSAKEISAGGGGEAVLIQKTITANGTFAAADDNADGFSSVTVDVPGGLPKEVPDGYTQLKYVESTGTQIVNTGVTPTMDTTIEIQFYMMPGGRSFLFPTGCTNPSIAVAIGSSTSGGGYCSFGNVGDKTLGALPIGGDAPIYTLSKDEAIGRASPGLPVVSVALNATALENVNPATRIGIFGRYNGNTPERFAFMRLFREKIWDGDTLLCEFVPAMENATEEVGLYDIVNGVFHRNAGTGVLVGGAR
jgi:hypothetical protein